MSMMPRPTAPMVGPGGTPTREWLDYLRGLADTGDLTGIARAIEKLQQQVTEIERTPAVAGEVQGIGAIRSLGLLAEGLVRLDLRELEDAGGGELVKILRDVYGRVAGTSPANTGDLPEGSNLYFTDARAAAAAPVQSVNGQAGAVEIAVPKGCIDGLVMQWGGAAQLAITAGAAYIPSAGRIVELPAAVTKAGLTLPPSTWHHVYMHNDLGVPGIEIVTAAPAEPYSGTARAKGGDNSRRYLGSLLTDAAGGIYRFGQNGDQIDYLVAPAPPFRVLSGGVATTKTTVSLAGVVPITSQYVIANTINNSDLQLFVDVPEIGNTGLTTRYTCLANQRTPILAVVPGRALTYQYAAPPTGSGAFIDVWGYKYGR